MTTGTEVIYGQAPRELTSVRPDWSEYMHYLYLPVKMAGNWSIRVPARLQFVQQFVDWMLDDLFLDRQASWIRDQYFYVTARRGYATPGNPLNRPGWHADGFGSDDLNYIWSDRWPTRFALGQFERISDDHVRSAEQFLEQVEDGRVQVFDGRPLMFYRLNPSVVHATPIIDAPGGDRSFLKISVSPNRYNLLGNSHNYLFDYAWRMFSRAEVRNDPAYAGGDSGPQGDEVRRIEAVADVGRVERMAREASE